MKVLEAEIDVAVRFSDTDAMGVVWHGNYLKFFEDGREYFGKKYGMEYLEMYNKGFFTPIVHSSIDHRAAINFGDGVKVIATLIPTPAAKIIFEYKIINTTTGAVAARGKTIQVFLKTDDRTLELSMPEWYLEWMRKHDLTKK